MGVGVRVTGPLIQYPAGTYPTHYDTRGLGGYRVVADHAARNAIFTLQRTIGMYVQCLSDPLGSGWLLNTATNTGTDADWTAASLTGGGGGIEKFASAFALDSDVVVSTDQDPRIICLGTGTFTSWRMAAKVGPVGADLIIDYLLSTDNGSTWNSLFLSNSTRPTIADGSVAGSGTTFDAISTFAPGNLLRRDVIQIGSSTAGQTVSAAILGTL